MAEKVQLAVLCGSPENCDYQTECCSKDSRSCPYANHQDSFRGYAYNQNEKNME